MTRPFATGTYTLLRGNTTDDYGDDQDVATAVSGYSSLVGSVVEQSQASRRRVDGTPRDVRRYIGRFAASVPFTADDRLRDNATGDVYVVVEIRKQANPVTGKTHRLILTKVT